MGRIRMAIQAAQTAAQSATVAANNATVVLNNADIVVEKIDNLIDAVTAQGYVDIEIYKLNATDMKVRILLPNK